MVATLALTLALLLVQEEAAPPLPNRRHDVHDLLSLRGGGEVGLDLCPHRSSEKGGEAEDLDAGGALLDLSNLRDLVFSCVIHDSKHEVTIDPDGDALRVTADEEVQAGVEQILREIRAALGEPQEIELRVLIGRSARLDGAALHDLSEADRLEREFAREGGSLRTGRIRTSGGGAGFFFDVDDATYVKDFEVEIAHGAELFDPIVATLQTGLTAIARASRGADGVLLDLALAESEPVEPGRELELRPEIWLTSPLSIRSDQAKQQDPNPTGGTIVTGPIPLKIELPATRCLGVAGKFFVPDGRALCIPCSVETTAGRVEFTLDVRAKGTMRPTVRHLALAPGAKVDRILVLAPLSTRFGIELPQFDEHSLLPALFHDEPSSWPSDVRLADVPAFDVQERLQRLVAGQPDAYLSVQPLAGDWWLALSQVPLDDATVHTIEAAFALPAPSGQLELAGRIERDGKPVADFRMPLLPGALATIWSGVSGSFLASWGVDVAGDTAIGNPDVGAFLDGFGLAFVAQPVGADRMQLDVRGVLDFLDGPPTEKAIDNLFTPTIEDVKTSRLFVRETRTTRRNGASYCFHLGGRPLALELTVTRN